MEKNRNYIYERKFTVGIIGFGNIGFPVAKYLLERFYNVRINLKSRYENYVKLVADDDLSTNIRRNGILIPSESIRDKVKIYRSIDGTSGGERFLDSDIIINCARNSDIQFSSFKERNAEYKANQQLLEDISDRLKGFEGILLNITNPLEPTCEKIHQLSEIPRNRIIGMSYTDTNRFQDRLRIELRNIDSLKDKKIDLEKALVIGEHGPSMVLVYSLIKISGQKLIKYMEERGLDTDGLHKRLNKALREDPTKLQTGISARRNTETPAEAAVKTIEAILSGEVSPMSSYDGDCFITLPSYYSEENKLIEIDNDFLGRISNGERKKFYESKYNILGRLVNLNLMNVTTAMAIIHDMHKKRQLSETTSSKFFKSLKSKKI